MEAFVRLHRRRLLEKRFDYLALVSAAAAICYVGGGEGRGVDSADGLKETLADDHVVTDVADSL